MKRILVLAVLILAAFAQTAPHADAKPHLSDQDQRWLGEQSALLIISSRAATEMGDQFISLGNGGAFDQDRVMADFAIFDAVSNAADAGDAPQNLHLKKADAHYDRAYALMSESGTLIAEYLVTYDPATIQTATDNMAKATSETKLGTQEITKAGAEI